MSDILRVGCGGTGWEPSGFLEFLEHGRTQAAIGKWFEGGRGLRVCLSFPSSLCPLWSSDESVGSSGGS